MRQRPSINNFENCDPAPSIPIDPRIYYLRTGGHHQAALEPDEDGVVVIDVGHEVPGGANGMLMLAASSTTTTMA